MVGELTIHKKDHGFPVIYKPEVRLLCDVLSFFSLCRITHLLYADAELDSCYIH